MSNERKVDVGDDNLLYDLNNLLARATGGAFHDFKSESATPKMDLAASLQELYANVKSGRYDNQA